jgi:superfamily II DNA helicase RecQ
LIKSARNDPNRSRFAKDGSNPVNRYFCNNCKLCFKDKSKMDQHLKQQKKKSIKCTLSDCNHQQCMQLFCNRYYPVADLNAAGSNAPTDQDTSSSHSPNGSLASTNGSTLLANPNLVLFDFSSIGAELGTLCTEGRTLTETTMRNLLPSRLSAGHFVELFHQLVSQHGSEDAFLDVMRKNVEAMDNHKVCILSDERMGRLVEAFERMLKNFIGPNKMVTRNLSSLIVRFNTDDEYGNVHNTERNAFRERKTQHDVLNAFKELLAFLHHKQPRCFQEVMDKLADTSINSETIHKQCIIPNLMYHLAAEEPFNREHDTLYMEFALSGMFIISGASLRFKSTGGCSSCLATDLYLVRLCMMYKAASILMVQNHPDRNGLVKGLFVQVQSRPSTQNLSKGISLLRISLKSEAKPEKVRVDQEGNLSLQGIVFRQVFYRGMIKTVATNLHHLFCQIFEGEDWKSCLSENATFTFGDDQFYGDVVCEAKTSESEETVTVALNELSLKSNINGKDDELIQKLNALFELVFLGLGGGAERKTSITSMTSNQVCIIPDSSSVYYTLVHLKQYRVETMDRTPSNHKMASIFFPYYLLFRRVVGLLNTAQEEKCLVFIKIDKPSWTLSNWMATFFHLNHSKLSLRIIRQFFTSITNKTSDILEKQEVKTKFTASRVAAESCNHSEIAHTASYATLLADDDELFYHQYHLVLGLPPSASSSLRVTSFAPASEDRILEALRCFHGPEADYFSDSQREMVLASCNVTSKHKFFGTHCGSGKSAATVIPPVVSFLSNRNPCVTVLIEPYRFLTSTMKASFHNSFQEKFGDAITVEAFSGADIHPNPSSSFPANLIEAPPNVLVLTLDAAANLIKHHTWALEKWSNEGLLRAVKIDEVQTLFIEFGFREVYQAINQFATLGCEVTLLSGSCPKQLVMPLMRSLRLLTNEQSESEVCTVCDDDLIRDGFDFVSVKSTNRTNAQLDALKLVKAALESNKGDVHVICAEKRDAEWLYEKARRILSGFSSEIVTSETSSVEVDQIAEAWRSFSVRLLITTTCGLVGNENKKARFVFLFQCLYSITNLVQGVGRLRLDQRGDDSIVLHIASEDYWREEEGSRSTQLHKSGDRLMEQLSQVNFLSSSDCGIFKDWFHISGYLDFLRAEGRCQLQHLAEMTGKVDPPVCKRCTYCLFSKAFCSATEAVDRIKSTPSLPDMAAEAAMQIEHNLQDQDTSQNRGSLWTHPIQRDRRQAQSQPQGSLPILHNSRKRPAEQTTASLHSRATPPTQNATIQARRQRAEEEKLESICIEKLSKLRSYCGVCGSVTCNGEICQSQCYICGDTHSSGEVWTEGRMRGHPRPGGFKNCPWYSTNERGIDLATTLGDRGLCPFCLCPRNLFGLLHKTPGQQGSFCSVQKRFVRLVCHRRVSQNNNNRDNQREVVTHDDFVLQKFASLSLWKKWLADARITNRR